MHVLRQDFVYAVRQLRKTPGFTLLVVFTIALGIGANTAVFSLLNGFLRPLPVRGADRLVILAARTKGDETGMRYRFSIPAFQELRKQTGTLSDMFAFNPDLAGLAANGKTMQFLFLDVSGNYFDALGLKSAAGRLFAAGESETASDELHIVLGYTYWQRRFGGDPGVVEKQVRLNGRAARIVGVAPKGFYGTYAGADMEGYVTLSFFAGATSGNFFTNRMFHPLTLGARLNPGVSIAEAQSSMDVVMRRFEREYPATDKDITVRVLAETMARPMPLRSLESVLPAIRGFVLALAALVVTLACMNVANLLLVRATVREREMAIRAALGSGRRRLISQMLTESMLLALMGAVAGLLLGRLGSQSSVATIDIGTDLPFNLDVSFDWRVFLFALASAVLTGVLIGIWPAIRASQTDAGAVLHDGGRGSGGRARQRMRSLLVVGQVAGSLVLLIVAGLFVRSLRNAQQVDLGLNPDHLVHVRMDTRYAGYDRQRGADFYRELERRVQAMPGVQSAGLAFSVPMGYIFDGQFVYPEGKPVIPGEQPMLIGENAIDESYFTAMQIPIVRGRGFTGNDTEGSRLVAVINQTMAARLWPGQEPIGRRFHVKTPDGPLFEVIGVARDSKYLAVFETPLPYIYLPLTQWDSQMRVLIVRSSMAPESLKTRLQQELQTLDPNVPFADLQTMREGLKGLSGFLLFRIGALQAAEMGGLGLLLAVIGVYGVVSYGAAQRTREIGIRMALGAQPADILRMILLQGALMVAGGVATGLFTAAGVTRMTRGFLLLVSWSDPLTFAGVTLLLAAVALWACLIPARRAMRVDPMIALRHE